MAQVTHSTIGTAGTAAACTLSLTLALLAADAR